VIAITNVPAHFVTSTNYLKPLLFATFTSRTKSQT